MGKKLRPGLREHDGGVGAREKFARSASQLHRPRTGLLSPSTPAVPKCRYSVTAPPAVIVRFHSFAGTYLRGQRGGWLNAVYGSLSYRARTARRAHKRIGTNHRRRRISIIIEHVLKNTRRRRLQDARVLRDLTITNSHTVRTSKRSSYHDEAYVCALRPENWSNILTG